MRKMLVVVGLLTVWVVSAFGAEGEGYDATIAEKTDIFMNKERVATIPESALFRAMKLRDNWVFGTYKDVDTDKEVAGWIQIMAIADVDKMRAALKAQSESYLLDGERRYQEKKYAEAIRLLTESIDRYPEQPRALKLRAESYMFLGRMTEAGRDYSRIIEIAPKSKEAIDALLSRASIYINLRDYQRATKDLGEVLKIQPKNAEAHLYMGDIQYAFGSFEEAVALYSKGVQFDPRLSALYYKRGLANFYLNMFDEALVDLGKAVELNKQNTAYQTALVSVSQHVRMLENIAPAQARKMLKLRVVEQDGRLLASVTNRSDRPLLNIEVAMAAFVENTFEKERDELMGGHGSRSFTRGRMTEEDRLTALDIEVHKIRFLPRAAAGSNQNTRIITGKPFAQAVSARGKEYFGCIVILFVNKQDVLVFSDPRSLERDFSDTITEMRAEVRGGGVK